MHVPGFGELDLRHVVLDFNGTIAEDGDLLPGVARRIRQLAGSMAVSVVTADTHGTCEKKLAELPCAVEIIEGDGAAGGTIGREARAKLEYVRSLGTTHCAAFGNGANDGPMLQACALGVAVVQRECACMVAVAAADMVATDIRNGLDLLLKPARLLAGLRR